MTNPDEKDGSASAAPLPPWLDKKLVEAQLPPVDPWLIVRDNPTHTVHAKLLRNDELKLDQVVMLMLHITKLRRSRLPPHNDVTNDEFRATPPMLQLVKEMAKKGMHVIFDRQRDSIDLMQGLPLNLRSEPAARPEQATPTVPNS